MKDAWKMIGAIFMLMVLFVAVSAVIGYTKRCPGVEQGETLSTNMECYRTGVSVVFTFRNTWDESILYDTELRETLIIYDSEENVIVMLPELQTFGIFTLEPNETLDWIWNQTYHLWEGNNKTTWDKRTDTQVPGGKYTARIEFASIQEEVDFWIIDW
jgi:hypothetical protein